MGFGSQPFVAGEPENSRTYEIPVLSSSDLLTFCLSKPPPYRRSFQREVHRFAAFKGRSVNGQNNFNGLAGFQAVNEGAAPRLESANGILEVFLMAAEVYGLGIGGSSPGFSRRCLILLFDPFIRRSLLFEIPD